MIGQDRCCGGSMSRRDLLRWAILGASAWVAEPTLAFGAVSDSSVPNGRKILEEATGRTPDWIRRYAASKDNPWAVMHGVRAIGSGFSAAGGPAVDFLCSHFLKEKEEGAERYLYMPKEIEAHTDTFLKTLLEAGVGVSRPIVAGGRQRTIGELVASAKKLFSLDRVKKDRDDLAWSLIAYSITTRPEDEGWTNALGERIRFREVVQFAFDTAEWASATFSSTMKRGAMPSWKDRISNFTCGGTHLVYSLAVAVRYGHLGKEGRQRLAQQLDLLTWRIKADLYLQDQYFELLAKATPTAGEARRLYQLDAGLKFLGHCAEVFRYARIHRLYAPSRSQEAQIRWGEEMLGVALSDVLKVNMDSILKEDRTLANLFVSDVCHAYHGLKLVKGIKPT